MILANEKALKSIVSKDENVLLFLSDDTCMDYETNKEEMDDIKEKVSDATEKVFAFYDGETDN